MFRKLELTMHVGLMTSDASASCWGKRTLRTLVNVNYVYGRSKPAWILALSQIIVPSFETSVPSYICFSAVVYMFQCHLPR